MKRTINQIGGAESPPPSKRQKRVVGSPTFQSTGFGHPTFTLQIHSQSSDDDSTGLDPHESTKQKKMKLERDRIIEIRKQKYAEEDVEMYRAINEIRIISTRHEINLPIPELAVVGMQSDGKSSFVEALMGFKFNITSTEIGTRRPLVIQMNNDPSQANPQVFFLSEDMKSKDENPTPLEDVEKEIIRRTNALVGRNAVHSRPIVLEIRYRHCSNLTIYDFPGFRKSRTDPLGSRIEEMVLECIQKNPNLFIICLEQSTVEWINTQVRPIIEKIDPRRKRTMFISTKFNNRINQFRTSEEINRFIENGIHSSYPADIYFMSLPSGFRSQGLNPSGFKDSLVDTHLADIQTLFEVGFNERKYLPLIGFHRIEDHLRRVILSKYRTHLHPIQRRILGVLIDAQRESQEIQEMITQKKKMNVKDFLGERINEFVVATRKALNGSTDFIGLQAGLSLEEERVKSRCSKWPGYNEDLGLGFRHSGLKLFGGAQIDRLIHEFETIAHSMEFRKVSPSEVATALGLGGLFGSARGGYGQDLVRASSDLAARNSRTAFTPLVKVLMERSICIMDHLFLKVGEYLESENDSSYEWMKLKSLRYVTNLLEELKKKVLDELETFTKVLDWEFISDLVDNHNLHQQQQQQQQHEQQQRKQLQNEGDEDDDDDDNNNFSTSTTTRNTTEEEEEEEDVLVEEEEDDDDSSNMSVVSTISKNMMMRGNGSYSSSSNPLVMSSINNNNNNMMMMGSDQQQQQQLILNNIPPPPPSSTRKTNRVGHNNHINNNDDNNNNGVIMPPPPPPSKKKKKKKSNNNTQQQKRKKKKKRKKKSGGSGIRRRRRGGYNYLDPTKEETVSRVLRHTRRRNSSGFLVPEIVNSDGNINNNSFSSNNNEMDQSSSEKIQIVAAKLFSGIRLMFVRFVKMKYTVDFLQPFLEGGLERMFRTIFSMLKEEDIRGIISVTIEGDKKRKMRVDEQIEDIREQHKKLSDLKRSLERGRKKKNGGGDLLIRE